MIKTFIAVSAFAVAGAASAETFTENGVTYTYTVAHAGQATIISGADNTHRPFQLRVVHGRVAGHFAGTPVSFNAPAKPRVASSSALASR